MSVSFYMDVHVQRPVTQELRRKGVDVLTAQEDDAAELEDPHLRTAYPGRVVLICNEGTGSDGEYFCTGFRAMQLGPTVGTRTRGGFMAVGGFAAIDGGSVPTPVQGSFTAEGR